VLILRITAERANKNFFMDHPLEVNVFIFKIRKCE